MKFTLLYMTERQKWTDMLKALIYNILKIMTGSGKIIYKFFLLSFF